MTIKGIAVISGSAENVKHEMEQKLLEYKESMDSVCLGGEVVFSFNV